MNSVGVLTKSAFRKWGEQTSWPTGITTFPVTNAAAGYGIPLMEESFSHEPEHEEYATLYAKAGLKSSQLVGHTYKGHILCQGMYNSLDRLICCAMGFENPNDPGATYHGSPELGGVNETHIFELDDVLSEQDWSSSERNASGAGGGTWTSDDDKVRFGSLFFDKGPSSHVFAPVMWDKMVFSSTFQRTTLRFEGQANAANRSAVNYPSTNWSIAGDQSHLTMSDAYFYMGSTDGTSLTWQEFGITKFELVLENSLEFIRDTKSGLYLKEPKRTDRRKCYGGFDFGRYENDIIIDAIDDDVELYAYIKYASGDYLFNIYLPKFYLKTVNYNIEGAGVIKPKHTFELHKPTSDPFSGDAQYYNIALKKFNEFHILVCNDNGYNVLTEEP